MACSGYRPADIDDMPFCDVLSLLALWREQPPLAEIVVMMSGFRPSPSHTVGDPSNIAELLARSPDGRLTTGV